MKILVAYDGSHQSNRALREAINLAKELKGSISVLYVTWEKSDVESRSLISNAEDNLKKTGVKYKLIIERSEYIPRRIIRVSKDGAFDLIAIGNRGFEGGKSWVLNSVSRRVIADASCPVLIVK
jgi:nucleotide-binding universal stress UspA family protein